MAGRGGLHVVMGTGPLGLAVNRHLAGTGRRVRAVSRGSRADLPKGVELVAADIADASEAERACDGADVVFHCANPPYARWAELHPPLMHAIIGGASAAGAKLVFGDNLYAYGPVDGPLTEDLPYLASGPNGRTRARIADDLMIAHQQRRVRATIGRGSDFFGPHAHPSTVGDLVFARALAGKPARVLGDPGHPAYGHLHRGLRASVGDAWRPRGGAGCGVACPQRRGGDDAPVRGDGLRIDRSCAKVADGSRVGTCARGPVQAHDPGGAGADLPGRTPLGRRQRQVRADLRLDRHTPVAVDRGNDDLVPGAIVSRLTRHGPRGGIRETAVPDHEPASSSRSTICRMPPCRS